MKKPRKPPAAPAARTPAPVPPEDAASAAHRDLTAGRFREAITGYKDLIKQGDAPQWRRGLADAYAGRAGQLMEKGMVKEALVIWENRGQLGEAAPPSAAHADLLLRLGQTAKATALYRQAQQGGDGASLADLAMKLAVHFLAGEAGIAEGLAPDDPILVHGTAARAALAAYCAGDTEALATSLAGIPFRSPYRDWAQILKALQRLPDQTEAAAGLLARVPDGSAFAGLRRAAELALVPEAQLPSRLAGATEATRRFALTLRGWGEERQVLWQEAMRCGPSPQGLLRMMQRYRVQLGDDWARRQALRLLIADWPRSQAWLQEAGGKRPTPAETALVAAWRAEQGRDQWRMLDAWDAYASQLVAAGVSPPGCDAAVRLALVKRRTDRVTMVLQSAGASGETNEIDQHVADLLDESLIHDPDDADTYLRMVTYYRKVKAPKDARRVLEPALARWPEDLRVLTAALDLALATNVFKKATGLARRILDLDPINTGARERLVKAHIAHARKQIRGLRADLARKELAQASEWGGEAARERVDLTAAFVTQLENSVAGPAALRAQAERLGGGLAASLALAIEAAAIGQSLAPLLRLAGLAKVKHTGREDLLACLDRLRAHLDGGERLSRDLSQLLDGQIKAAAVLDLSPQEAEGVCETLRRATLDLARLAFAKAALKRWPGSPRFEFHAFEARYRGGGWAKDNDLDRVAQALNRARAEGDNRTAHRLEELLSEFGSPFFSPDGFDDFDDLDDEFDPAGDLMASLVDAMGLDGLANILDGDPKLKRQFDEMRRELGPDRLAEVLKALAKGIVPGNSELPPLPPAGKKPKAPKPTSPKGTKSPRGPEDDDLFDQLDLF